VQLDIDDAIKNAVGYDEGLLPRLAEQSGTSWQLHDCLLSHLSPTALTRLSMHWDPPLSPAAW